MFQLVLQVIVIERAHSCHQICNTELSMMLHNLTRDPCLMDIMIVIIIMTGAQFHRLIDMPGTGYIYTYLLVMDLVPETWVLEVPWVYGKMNKCFLHFFPTFWGKMKKSLVQHALNPFFGWFRVPENPVSGIPSPSLDIYTSF